MAGQSGHNLSISKGKLGAPRFPFEQRGVGDGYGGTGPVITYTLSPEELAKYGPCRPRRQRAGMRVITSAEYRAAIDSSSSVEEAAGKLNMSPQRFKLEIGLRKIKYEFNNRKGENDMPVNTTAEPEDPAEQPQPERQKTRLEIAREKLTKDDYLILKEKQVPDNKICKEYGIHADIMVALKREWGIDIGERGGWNKGVKKTEDEPSCTGPTLTIAQAITLQGDLDEDIDVLGYVLDATREQLSPRIEKLLTDHLAYCKDQAERIVKAFHTTEIAI